MRYKKLTLKQVKEKARVFQKIKTLQEVASLLAVSKNEVILLGFNPEYYHFTMPKKNGKLRHIEAPALGLKSFQRKLNYYLQAVYYMHQSKSAYGYIIKPLAQPYVKGIYNNAKLHLGCNTMLNADFENFFHQISISDVATIFKSKLFSFNNYTAYTLAKICCYKDRLPMGAPTSPALSNLFALPLDKQLTLWATKHQIKYSRFVDDLTFSSVTKKINTTTFSTIEAITKCYHLNFNKSKTTYFKANDTKLITGLVLNKTVDIDPLYYIELEKDIDRLHKVVELYTITGQSLKNVAIKTFKQELIGKINFIKSIEGNTSQEYNTYLNKFIEAQTVEEQLVTRWTKFGNYE